MRRVVDSGISQIFNHLNLHHDIFLHATQALVTTFRSNVHSPARRVETRNFVLHETV